MRVLLIGADARTHALAWKIAQSPLLEQLFIAPGNPGTAQLGRNVPVDTSSSGLLIDVARRERIDLAVVVPEHQLAEGLADMLAAAQIPTFGATAAAARALSSRLAARRLIAQAGVPAPPLHLFDDAERASTFARLSGRSWVVASADRAVPALAPADIDATLAAITQVAAAAPGQPILLEPALAGPELEICALCDGASLIELPPVGVRYRLGDGDSGPFTAGMGAYAPAPIDSDVLDDLVHRHLGRISQALSADGAPFRGMLCARAVLTELGPQLIDLLPTFGENATPTMLPLIEGDWLTALRACAGGADTPALQPRLLAQRHSVAVGVALAGARPGSAIDGIESIDEPETLPFYGDLMWQEGGLVASGERVLYVVGYGTHLRTARERAYAAIEDIHFPGLHYRTDIGS